MLRFLIAFPLAAATALANPISGYLVFPPHTMVAENVLIGLTEKGAVVSGRYRFRVTPDAPEHWGRPPYELAVQLPVPVPSTLKGFEDIEAEVHPFMTIRGERYTPVPEVFYYEVPALPKEVKLAVFYFRVDRADLEEGAIRRGHALPFNFAIINRQVLAHDERQSEDVRLGLTLDI